MKIFLFWLSFIVFTFSQGLAFADDAPNSGVPTPFEERIPDKISKKRADFFTLTSENDNYGDGSDQDYTNGILLTYYKHAAPLPDLAYTLADVLPTFKINETTSIYYSFGQNLYTPKDISTATPNPLDRPYAAFLYGSAGLNSIHNNHIDDVEVTVGVVGPLALGEEAQTLVHDTLNVQKPKGWDHQLDNELGLILSWQRSWPEALAAEWGALTFRLAPHGGATAGNVYTHINTGATFQIVPTAHKWQSTPLRVKPAIPGNGFFYTPQNQWAWSFFMGVDGRAVGRNIFLDGNTFSDGPSVEKKHLVADANIGFSLNYGKTRFSYTLNWRSKEFQRQNGNTLFGAISVGYRL